MDRDGEMMMHRFMVEEAIASVDEEEHFITLTALLRLLVDENVAPKYGASKSGRKESEPRQRMDGHAMLYTNYFADDPTFTP
jgi:hypothetical protein